MFVFILRWIAALAVAVAAYGAIFSAGSQIWKYLGGDPDKIIFYSAALATMAAMYAAAHVVARAYWRSISWTVLLLATLPPIVIMLTATSSGFTWLGLRVFGGVLLGGFMALWWLPRTLGLAK